MKSKTIAEVSDGLSGETPADSRFSALLSKKDWDGALAEALAVLEINPADTDARWAAGWALFQKEQYEHAIEHLRAGLEVGPITPSFLCALGATFLELGKYHQAELWTLRALSIGDTTIVRLILALTYMKLDEPEMAERVHLEGIRLRPKKAERRLAYADFLEDNGRLEEADKVRNEAAQLNAGSGAGG